MIMTQSDDFQEQVQAMRSVDVSLPLNAAPPATPDEIFHVDIQLDPDTQKEVVLWDDILQAFRNVVQVRNKTRVVPFLKGKDLRILEPRRIAAVPNTVLDVVVDNPLIDKGITSLQVQQLVLQPAPPPNDDRTMKVETVSQNSIPTPIPITLPSTTSTPITPSTATSNVPRNPVYGLVETAIENYSHIDRPLAFPSAQGPHAALDNQLPIVKDPAVPSLSVNSSNSQLQGPQNATSKGSIERDVVQMSISASHGDKDAQVALGDMYRDGKGVVQDYQAAMDWYLKAAEQGDAAGQQRVGGLYGEGLGVPQDSSTAMDWYLKAAEQGYAIAQNSIGLLYNNGLLYNFGKSVPQDYAQAMKWFLKAAEGGHVGSQHNIGLLYDAGCGVRRDDAQAMAWYLKAAEQGDAAAQNSMGSLYHHGFGAVPRDSGKAIDWYLKAAEQGYADAQHNLGVLYCDGDGVPQDSIQGIAWYLKAANQGYTAAQYNLASLYEYGRGVPQDSTVASEWLQKALQGSL